MSRKFLNMCSFRIILPSHNEKKVCQFYRVSPIEILAIKSPIHKTKFKKQPLDTWVFIPGIIARRCITGVSHCSLLTSVCSLCTACTEYWWLLVVQLAVESTCILQEKRLWTTSILGHYQPDARSIPHKMLVSVSLVMLVVLLIVVHIQGHITTYAMLCSCRCSFARSPEKLRLCLPLLLLLKIIYIEPVEVLICHLSSMLLLLYWRREHTHMHFRLVIIIACVECFKFHVEHFQKNVGAFINHWKVLFPIMASCISKLLLEL